MEQIRVSGPHLLKERHLAMHVKQDGRIFRAMAWRGAERASLISANKAGVRLAYSLDRNTFRGETTVELNVADIQPA